MFQHEKHWKIVLDPVSQPRLEICLNANFGWCVAWLK